MFYFLHNTGIWNLYPHGICAHAWETVATAQSVRFQGHVAYMHMCKGGWGWLHHLENLKKKKVIMELGGGGTRSSKVVLLGEGHLSLFHYSL